MERESRHDPRHLYDCGRCKFNWNCGILCACVLNKGRFRDPPKARAKEVEQAQHQWRERMDAIVKLEEAASLLSRLVDRTIDSGLPIEILKRAEDAIAPLDNLADDIGRFKHPEERDE